VRLEKPGGIIKFCGNRFIPNQELPSTLRFVRTLHLSLQSFWLSESDINTKITTNLDRLVKALTSESMVLKNCTVISNFCQPKDFHTLIEHIFNNPATGWKHTEALYERIFGPLRALVGATLSTPFIIPNKSWEPAIFLWSEWTTKPQQVQLVTEFREFNQKYLEALVNSMS
jgi:hypothetical protein